MASYFCVVCARFFGSRAEFDAHVCRRETTPEPAPDDLEELSAWVARWRTRYDPDL